MTARDPSRATKPESRATKPEGIPLPCLGESNKLYDGDNLEILKRHVKDERPTGADSSSP